MNVMIIIDVVIILFGLYMVISALRMKKTGQINATILAKEEADACKDTAGFISFIYWKEAIFGGVVVLVGVLGLINELVVPLGIGSFVEVGLFLIVFLWFQMQMRKAREKFI